ncbi:unnamed protein product [Chrysoparadoxa australica]
MRVNAQWNNCVQLFGAKTTYRAAVASEARVEVAAAEGCPLTAKLFKRAAGSGNLEVCIKLKSLNCPWNRKTCNTAAFGGHLEVLKLLCEGPDPLHGSAWTGREAARRGHLEGRSKSLHLG